MIFLSSNCLRHSAEGSPDDVGHVIFDNGEGYAIVTVRLFVCCR